MGIILLSKELENLNVIPIKKQNKDEQLIESYRPIALLPVHSKIMNKLIQKRIEKYINDNQILPGKQYVFKKGSSTHDYFVDLLNEIQISKKNKNKMILLSIDLSKAFDLVNNEKLINDLKQEKFDKNIVNWIYMFLCNREAILNTKEGKVKNITNKGIPQGSSLSPILFNIYTKTIHELQSQNNIIFQFADDISILIIGKNDTEIKNNTEKFIGDINNILREKDLKINVEKTQFMKLYSNNLNKINLNINGTIINESNNIKMLGLTISNHCSLSGHYKQKKIEIQKNLNLLKTFSYKFGGAHPETMINIFKSLIKSKISYAYEVTNYKAKTITDILQKIKNNGIRTCIGLTKTTPVSALLAESGEKISELDIKEKTLKYMARKISRNSIIGHKILNNNSLPSFQELLQEFPFLIQIAPEIKNKVTPKNLHVNIKINLKVKKDNNNNQEILAYKNKEIEKYKEFERLYTDGSKINNKCGIGIYYPTKDIEMGALLLNEVSIKSTEIFAILEAINFAVINKLEKIIILTDSLH